MKHQLRSNGWSLGSPSAAQGKAAAFRLPSGFLYALAWAAAMLVAQPLAAQEPAATDSQPAVEEGHAITQEARAVLDRMTAFLQGLDEFAIDAQISRDEVLPFGYKLQNNEWSRMIVRRPNRMRVDVDGDIKHRSYYYDGSRLTMLAPDEGVYAQTEAPDSIGALVNGLLNAGVELPLIDVLRQGFEGKLLDGVRYGLKVGESRIDGVVTDHLAFRQPSIDWQLWVARNGQPKKILITTRYEVGDPQYQAVLDWNLRPKISASTFTFSAPRDAREIPFDVTGAAVSSSPAQEQTP